VAHRALKEFAIKGGTRNIVKMKKTGLTESSEPTDHTIWTGEKSQHQKTSTPEARVNVKVERGLGRRGKGHAAQPYCFYGQGEILKGVGAEAQKRKRVFRAIASLPGKC